MQEGLERREDTEMQQKHISAEDQFNFVCSHMLARLSDSLDSNTRVLESHTVIINEMSRKIYNGYGEKINSLEKKLDVEIQRNIAANKDIKDQLNGISKFTGGALISIFLALLGVLGSVFLTNYNAKSAQLEVLNAIYAESMRDKIEFHGGIK